MGYFADRHVMNDTTYYSHYSESVLLTFCRSRESRGKPDRPFVSRSIPFPVPCLYYHVSVRLLYTGMLFISTTGPG